MSSLRNSRLRQPFYFRKRPGKGRADFRRLIASYGARKRLIGRGGEGTMEYHTELIQCDTSG